MSNFERNGFRTINYDLSGVLIKDLRTAWTEFVSHIRPYPGNFSDRGIVMCIGGLSYYTCGLITIRILRQIGCTLPIEAWYKGNELSDEVIDELGGYNVVCRDFNEVDHAGLSGVALKPLAVLKSRFKEICFIDSDNICIKDPASLFDLPGYRQYGAVFWPDYWKTGAENPIWKIVKHRYKEGPEQESGQLLIDKERCWREINLSVHFNSLSHIYHKILWGDKDTFRFAWMALKTPFAMIEKELATCGYRDNGQFLGTTMVQHDPHGNIYFLHRNLLKWDITKPHERAWTRMKRFTDGAQHRLFALGKSKNGHGFMDIEGDVEEIDAGPLFGEIEETCLAYLADIRRSPAYTSFAIHTYFATKRYIRGEKFSVVEW